MHVAGYVMMLELGISGVGYAWLVANWVGSVCMGPMVWRGVGLNGRFLSSGLVILSDAYGNKSKDKNPGEISKSSG